MEFSWFWEKKLFDARDQHGRVQVFRTAERIELRFGNKVVQSAIIPGRPDHLSMGYAYNMMLAFVIHPKAKDLLHIGLGGGTTVSYIHRYLPNMRQTAIERSALVVKAARQFFDLPMEPGVNVIVGDALEMIGRMTARHDLIFLDAYEADGPAEHLDQANFRNQLYQNLRSGGWVVVNIWTVLRPAAPQIAKWKSHFDLVLSAKVPHMGNQVLFCGKQVQVRSLADFHITAEALSQKLPLNFMRLLSRMRFE